MEIEIFQLPIDKITVNREKRQRRILDEEIAELARSIDERGLLNPIIVESTPDDYLLVAGERRLEAMRRLEWVFAPCRLLSDLTSKERTLIEWSENAHRRDLPWQDRASAIGNFHAEMTLVNAPWTYADTGRELGLSHVSILKYATVWRASRSNPTLLACTSINQAYNAIERRFSRELGAVLAEEFDVPDPIGEFTLTDPVDYAALEASDSETDPAARADMTATRVAPSSPTVISPVERKTHWEIAEGSFADWAAAYRGPPFSVIHCDFPFGVEFTNTGIFRKANALDTFYDDEAADFWGLCTTLRSHWEKLVAPSAHLIFWFSMNRYVTTLDFLQQSVASELGLDLYIDPFPLIWWKSDNKGMMHDAKHKPRRVYETAFLVTVGDHRLARAGSNVYAGPTAADKHPSAKPLPCIRQFLGMVCDETSRVLDPTCGHGSAISAAIALGARAAYGVEIDPTHVARARLEVRQAEERVLADAEVTF